MIIPQFKLTQTNKFVIIVIRLPYVKVQKTEFVIEGHSLKFFLHPYFLDLIFEQQFKDCDEPESAQYDHSTFELTCKIFKANEGEHFENLDMISKLCQKTRKVQKKNKKKPLIEIIGETSEFNEIIQDKEEINLKFKYGFNNEFTNFFEDLDEELLEIGQVNPETSSQDDRLKLRNQILINKFDGNNYLYDLYENEDVDYIVKKIMKKEENNYTSDEFNILSGLPKTEHLISDNSMLYRQMIDILFAICCENRIMDDDLPTESAITINRLSSTLCSFVVDLTLQHLIEHSYKRILTYPLIRHFELAQQVQKDVIQIIKGGKISIVKQFIKIKRIFMVSEPRYLLNTLFIDSFLQWIQNIQDQDLQNIIIEIENLEIEKKQFSDLMIIELEEMANDALNEQIECL